MKFFGRKPSSSPAWAATPHAANTPVFQTPMPTQGMTLSLHQCSAAELIVSTRGMKSAAEGKARFDVLLRARHAPLEAEWKLSPEQARELAARLHSAAAECDKADRATPSPGWD